MISFSADQPLRLADQGCFFVAGSYGDSSDGRTMTGQMFVQYQIPAVQKFPHPLVMIHGGGQTGVNFLGTPDGRKGWADYFVANGYAVYVVDQPGRGRSGYFSHRYGPSAGRGDLPRRKIQTTGRRPVCTRNGPAMALRAIPCSISFTRRRSKA